MAARKNPLLVKIAEKYDNHPSARLFGKVVTDEPEEDSVARDFIESLTNEDSTH